MIMAYVPLPPSVVSGASSSVPAVDASSSAAGASSAVSGAAVSCAASPQPAKRTAVIAVLRSILITFFFILSSFSINAFVF